MCKRVVTEGGSDPIKKQTNANHRGGGGGGMCILFEICKKTPFQKCMGWG